MPADDDASIDAAANKALRMGIDDIEIQGMASLFDVSEDRAKVYLNPTSDELNISFTTPVSARVSLFDSKGRLIQLEVVDDTSEMNFTIDAPAGTDILEIIEDEGSIQRVDVLKL